MSNFVIQLTSDQHCCSWECAGTQPVSLTVPRIWYCERNGFDFLPDWQMTPLPSQSTQKNLQYCESQREIAND